MPHFTSWTDLFKAIPKCLGHWFRWVCRTFQSAIFGLVNGKLTPNVITSVTLFNHPNLQDTTAYEAYQDTRKRLGEELKVRRDRQWTILTWVGGILSAIVAGVLAMAVDGKELPSNVRFAAGLWVSLVAIFSMVRILHDALVANYYSTACHELDKQFGLDFDDSSQKISVRQHHLFLWFILLLAAGAIVLLIFYPKASAPKDPPVCRCCSKSDPSPQKMNNNQKEVPGIPAPVDPSSVNEGETLSDRPPVGKVTDFKTPEPTVRKPAEPDSHK
jgi:hypothetical protein